MDWISSLVSYRLTVQRFRHGLCKLVEIVGGHFFLARPVQRLWQWNSQRHHLVPPPDLRCAMIAHVYHLELLDEVLCCWRMLPAGAPLHITTTPDKAVSLRVRLREQAGIFLHPAENRGRDIAPFLGVLSSRSLDRYDAVLKIHTKRSPHLRTGNLRRRLLYTLLAGHRVQVNRSLAQFADPRVGLVGWHLAWRTRLSYWMNNERRAQDLMHRIAPVQPVELAFFEGSMFWFRPAALEPLRRLGLTAEDFETEQGQIDGCLHHAIERCFTLVARRAGYETKTISGRSVY
jgi:lipopolysaccharide biosynthesis protein